MALTISELIDTIRTQLNDDPLVSAAVSSVISPEGRQFLSSVVSGVAALEAKHETDKAEAVEQAKASVVPQ
jgi:hypothetical protein